ncbi:MAG: Site-specific DNA-methyltransferase (adenine-specific) [Lachnoclostridium sp.]|jgi:DNA adenine methylase
MESLDVKPFLKWAGGKGQLLEQFENYYPEKLRKGKCKRYVEPFVGGGAVFFELIKKYCFEEVILNDINEDLILSYKVIRDNVNELIENLKNLENSFLELDTEHRAIMYYNIRNIFNIDKKTLNYKEYNNTWIKHAAHLIFLNRTCFNGLYRLNKKGEFNVPIGKYVNPGICNTNNLLNVNKALKNVKLICGDFENLTDFIDEDTFVYIDPPYRPINNTSSFNSYQTEDFNDESQKRLADWFRILDCKNASLMLSNSNPKNSNPDDNFFDILYQGYYINEVYASRQINSKSIGRGSISELLIRNYYN